MNRTERVRLGSRSYRIIIGPGVIDQAGGPVSGISRNALVVTNRKVDSLYGRRLVRALEKAGVKVGVLLLPDGERHKTMAAVSRIHDRLVRGRYDRDSAVVALGGGVIGDIAGFAAATYMRGVNLVQVPTTLLSQVDSSVGGKTGVNHPRGKNLIGAFYQPGAVLADISALKSLSRGEILCGVGEVIKYGCIASAKFFRFLEREIEALVGLQAQTTIEVVRTSCRIKAAVVSEDEKEKGRRAILNFGHTAGHAIEAVTGYKRYPHGYAVAMGMTVAAILSQMKGGLEEKDVRRITDLVKRSGLPAAIPGALAIDDLARAMEHDKKARAGKIRFALLKGIGRCEIRSDITRSEIREALRRSKYD